MSSEMMSSTVRTESEITRFTLYLRKALLHGCTKGWEIKTDYIDWQRYNLVQYKHRQNEIGGGEKINVFIQFLTQKVSSLVYVEYHWSIEISGDVECLFHIVFKVLSLVMIYFLKAAEFSTVNGSHFPLIKSYIFTLKKWFTFGKITNWI